MMIDLLFFDGIHTDQEKESSWASNSKDLSEFSDLDVTKL